MAHTRVLIVDKPEERLPFYRSVVGEFDAEIVIAYSSAGTLDQVLQEDYAVILMNLTAPGGDGLATVQRIRHHPRTRRTPIILIGMAVPGPAFGDIAGPVDYIPAPVVYEVLRAKVRIFVDLHRANAELASAYQALERRVAERTAQLQAANLSEKRLRREAEELSRLKDEFLATMSHELRTPLNAIFGWITLLRTGRLDAPTAERALETIERNARAQKHLIDDLLDVSRIVSGKVQLELTDFDPRQVMESALATMAPAAEARRITLTPELAVRAAPLRADFARLQQVVCNLLSNAIKFTPEGGRVWIRMDRDPGSMQITVTDTGQGHFARIHAFCVRSLPPGGRLHQSSAQRPGAGTGHCSAPGGAARGNSRCGQSRGRTGRDIHGPHSGPRSERRILTGTDHSGYRESAAARRPERAGRRR